MAGPLRIEIPGAWYHIDATLIEEVMLKVEGALPENGCLENGCWGYIKSRQVACVQKWTFGARVFISRSVAEADENMRWRAGVG